MRNAACALPVTVMSVKVQALSLTAMGDFFFGVFGALVGGGIVWGRMTQKIEHLEKRFELDAVSRAEIKADLSNLRAEFREDFRELQRLIMERMK